MRITKRVASCATSDRRQRSSGCSSTRATRCCRRPRPRTRSSSTSRASRPSRSPRRRARGSRPPSTSPSGSRVMATTSCPTSPPAWSPAGPSSARSPIASSGKGISSIFVPGGDAEPAGDYHDALSLLEDLAELGNPFAHVGITGYPESHPSIHRRPHRAGHVGQASSRLAHRQQPDLRPVGRARLVDPPAGPWRDDAAAARASPARSSAPSSSAWRRRSGSVSPPSSWPRTRACSRGWPHPGASPASPSWRSAAPALGEDGGAGRGPARVHVQPGRRDRGLAQRPAGEAPGLRQELTGPTRSRQCVLESVVPVSTTVSGRPMLDAACSASVLSSSSGSWASHTTRV